MTSTPLITTIEAKSRVVSHERLLEILATPDIETRSVKLENNDSLMRITVISRHDIPSHAHFQNFLDGVPRTGLQFLGLGFLPSDDTMRFWLHQWLMLPQTREDVEELHGTEQIPVAEVVERIKNHQAALHAWIETSRGW